MKSIDSNLSPQEQVVSRSPEMQEVIGRIPNRIIRWGIVVIFFVMTALLFISWFIQYPELLPAKVVITTSPPPVTLVSRTSGTLVLVKKENEVVHDGDIIAYIKSNATPESILLFETTIIHNENILESKVSSLGDLESHRSEIINATAALSNFRTNRIFDIQIDQLKKQVRTYEKLSESLIKQQKLVTQELALAKEKFKTDSILFTQQVTSAIDFNAARTSWLQQQRSARNAETTMINNETQLNQLSKQIADLEIQKLEEGQRLELTLQQARQNALAQIAKWKENFLFTASSNGVVSYLGFLEMGQFIEPSKPYFAVLPNGEEVVAHAELPLQSSGKVKVGQGVNIRLENYPFEQFGMLRGEVASISLMPGTDKYWVSIDLPNQLRTSQNKILPFKQQLSGTTEIITEDLRLLDRFFFQFRSLLKRSNNN